MNVVAVLILIFVVGALELACFFVGAKVGQTVSRGQIIETPTIDPMKKYQERKQTKELERVQKREAVVWENMENYNGTSLGQKDVPRG